MQACRGYLIMLVPTSSPASQGRGARRSFTAAAHPNHYALLGLSQHATSSDIKRAYRLLALKYHPDVNKEAGANEDFKSIRLAYDILIDEASRADYDKILHHQKSSRNCLEDEVVIGPDYTYGLRFYRWAYLRCKMNHDKHWEQYHTKDERFTSFDDASESSLEENTFEDGGTFIGVLRSAFMSLFLMQTVGIQLSLAFSSLMAFTDRKLDAGYKLGYMLAWILGGRAGILLTMILSFASWACGKTSSSVVVLVVVAMWFGSKLARYAPLPQGALLTLLYMSIKLQMDLI